MTIQDSNEVEGDTGNETTPETKSHSTPKQDEVKKKIAIENEMLVVLFKKREQNLMTENDRREIRTRSENLEKLKAKLHDLKKSQGRSSKYRKRTRANLEEFGSATRKKITGKGTATPGRPTKYDSADLIEAICRIAIPGSAAHERRRNEVIRTVKTLDQLTAALNREGYDLKRSSVYLHLLPRNAKTIEGKRHINTAPVKLLTAQNSKHADHISQYFARSSIRSLEEIATVLGPDEVIFHSMDDKAKVPIGVTAANNQTQLLMHMEY